MTGWIQKRVSYGLLVFGAIIHAFCGIATSGITTGHWLVGFEGSRELIATVQNVGQVASVSVVLFIFARLILAIGEAGNFPAAIKSTAEYFPIETSHLLQFQFC